MYEDDYVQKNTKIYCYSCDFWGEIDEYNPCVSIYNDIRCPKCGSTDNKHNAEYQDRLSKAMNKES